MQTIHNPDHYMTDLRQIMSQGRKRIGLFIGAGAPTSIRVDRTGKIAPAGSPLIPDVAGLTGYVVEKLAEADRSVVEGIRKHLGDGANIEAILTQVRRLAQAIGADKIYGLNGEQYEKLGERICAVIGDRVAANLPDEENPYSELVSWIAGTQREHSVEIFTPNYDLLVEEAFERARMPYFDGFTGAHMPFFDPVSISTDVLPKRWSRLWKLHGSLGWDGMQQPLGLGFPFQPEAAVNAGDDEIERCQDVIGVIERPVGQEIGFDALQDPEVLAEASVQTVRVSLLLGDLIDRKAASIVGGSGVVGDPEIGESALARGLGHRLDRLRSV